jgi:hypothetical protein
MQPKSLIDHAKFLCWWFDQSKLSLELGQRKSGAERRTRFARFRRSRQRSGYNFRDY